MLVLTRKVGEFLLVGEDIEVRIVRIDGDQVRLGIVAPRQVSILRGELVEEIRNETATAAAPATELVQKVSQRLQPPAAQPAAATDSPSAERNRDGAGAKAPEKLLPNC